ncbi:unnamed protein product, partial [Amoebophrya sp. A25]
VDLGTDATCLLHATRDEFEKNSPDLLLHVEELMRTYKSWLGALVKTRSVCEAYLNSMADQGGDNSFDRTKVGDHDQYQGSPGDTDGLEQSVEWRRKMCITAQADLLRFTSLGLMPVAERRLRAYVSAMMHVRDTGSSQKQQGIIRDAQKHREKNFAALSAEWNAQVGQQDIAHAEVDQKTDKTKGDFLSAASEENSRRLERLFPVDFLQEDTRGGKDEEQQDLQQQEPAGLQVEEVSVEDPLRNEQYMERVFNTLNRHRARLALQKASQSPSTSSGGLASAKDRLKKRLLHRQLEASDLPSPSEQDLDLDRELQEIDDLKEKKDKKTLSPLESLRAERELVRMKQQHYLRLFLEEYSSNPSPDAQNFREYEIAASMESLDAESREAALKKQQEYFHRFQARMNLNRVAASTIFPTSSGAERSPIAEGGASPSAASPSGVAQVSPIAKTAKKATAKTKADKRRAREAAEAFAAQASGPTAASSADSSGTTGKNPSGPVSSVPTASCQTHGPEWDAQNLRYLWTYWIPHLASQVHELNKYVPVIVKYLLGEFKVDPRSSSAEEHAQVEMLKRTHAFAYLKEQFKIISVFRSDAQKFLDGMREAAKFVTLDVDALFAQKEVEIQEQEEKLYQQEGKRKGVQTKDSLRAMSFLSGSRELIDDTIASAAIDITTFAKLYNEKPMRWARDLAATAIASAANDSTTFAKLFNEKPMGWASDLAATAIKEVPLAHKRNRFDLLHQLETYRTETPMIYNSLSEAEKVTEEMSAGIMNPRLEPGMPVIVQLIRDLDLGDYVPAISVDPSFFPDKDQGRRLEMPASALKAPDESATRASSGSSGDDQQQQPIPVLGGFCYNTESAGQKQSTPANAAQFGTCSTSMDSSRGSVDGQQQPRPSSRSTTPAGTASEGSFQRVVATGVLVGVKFQSGVNRFWTVSIEGV